MISVIVPIKNETPEAARKFCQFVCTGASELLVADGGEQPETSLAFEAIGARIIGAGGTRGRRLDLAARQASGDILFFLHADSRPPERALELVRLTLARAAAGAFSLGYEEATPALRWIAWWANVRSRLLKLPFGDQGLFCRREAYERAGGYRDMPVCDDVDLVRRLKRAGPFDVLREKTLTSPRRYRERGALRQVLTNWKVLFGYFAGVPARTLERWYQGRPRLPSEESRGEESSR
jgi:rSAM/selenodomain-associated transferase 2